MTTYQTPLIVGIFQAEHHAKQAVDTLRTVGFRYDQVGVAISSSNNATSNLQADLVKLGMPEEQASYYDNAYKSGKIVVSIRPDGREHEVSEILEGNGAYSYEQGATTADESNHLSSGEATAADTTSASASSAISTAEDEQTAENINSSETATDTPADHN